MIEMIKYGDIVSYDLRRSHGTLPEQAYVIGELSYSDNGSHLLLCNPGQIGMPIHSSHLTFISSGHEKICDELKAKYLKRWPDGLKE